MSAKVFSARLYQKECNIATPRSKVGWTAGSHDVGKLTLPSFPEGEASSWAAAGRALASAVATREDRRYLLMAALRVVGGEITLPRYDSGDGYPNRHKK